MTLEDAVLEFGEELLMDMLDGGPAPTRCPEGCEVEADGRCPHGYESVLRAS